MWAGTVGGLKGEGGRIYAQDVQLERPNAGEHF